jgi:uncharacterized protein (DUF2235 family)
MNYAGLLQPQDEGSIKDAYAAYGFRQHERVRTRFHHGAAHGRSRQVRVRFLGVFDTVGALGLPLDWVKRITADLPHLNLQFHDTRLCGNVDVACQALAIDERRGPYEPTWWEAPAPGAALPEKILQVWFPGVHSDVGGGYADDKSLAEVALGWMLEQAREAGLDVARRGCRRGRSRVIRAEPCTTPSPSAGALRISCRRSIPTCARSAAHSVTLERWLPFRARSCTGRPSPASSAAAMRPRNS